MQVCTSLQTDNHANTSPLSFLQAGCPSCHPTNSVKALKDLNVSLQYLVKYLCSKNRHAQEVIEENCRVRPSHSKTVSKYLSGKISIT